MSFHFMVLKGVWNLKTEDQKWQSKGVAYWWMRNLNEVRRADGKTKCFCNRLSERMSNGGNADKTPGPRRVNCGAHNVNWEQGPPGLLEKTDADVKGAVLQSLSDITLSLWPFLANAILRYWSSIPSQHLRAIALLVVHPNPKRRQGTTTVGPFRAQHKPSHCMNARSCKEGG